MNSGCPFSSAVTVAPPKRPFTPLPERMKHLPVSKSGWLVPWFVDWHDGEPEFRAMDPVKWKRAINEKLCWVCGQRLGVHMAFLIGPMCAINRATSEPACHLDCARWSAQNCPFLSRPHMVRREDGELIPNPAGMVIERNPGAMCIWTTRTYVVFRCGRGYLLEVGEPIVVEWWAEGKPATRAQIEHSITTGLPLLEAEASKQEGGIEALREAQARILPWLPKE
jgi:hypothetical protein